MDSVQETPLKRRKLVGGDVSQAKPYDSGDDSGDSLFDHYETVATLPINQASRLGGNVTQVTQIVRDGSQKENHTPRSPTSSIVQVQGSSPVVKSKSPPTVQRPPVLTSRLANTMAPMGTMFRPPGGIVKPPASTIQPQKKDVVDISSDEDELARFRRHDSDDEGQDTQSANIKPTVFKTKPRPINGQTGFGQFKYVEPTAGKPNTIVGGSLQGSVYDSRNRDDKVTSSTKIASARSGDIMASAYGGRVRPAHIAQQSRPAKASAPDSMSLEDVADASWRQKIQEIRVILPYLSVQTCYTVLQDKKGNKDDALEALTSGDVSETVDLTLESPDDMLEEPRSVHKKAPAKQQLKAPTRTIQEKWAQKPSGSNLQAPAIPASPSEQKAKPRRRLVQGRKHDSSPVRSPASSQTKVKAKPKPSRSRAVSVQSDTDADSDSEESDSGIGTEPETPGIRDELVAFFNSCGVPELLEIASTTSEYAEQIIKCRPYSSLNDVRQVLGPIPPGRKTAPKKPIGERIVEKCWDMFVGYDAIDKLVRKCENLGIPLRDEMKAWGVTETSSSKDGETELADIDAISNATRDSAIGTPSSHAGSVEDDNEAVDPKKARKRHNPFFPQPTIMAEGVNLKDYQVIGINWLSMLFDRKLSGILADDMGLGKTCQVVSFLAHLKERKNETGVHLIIVPASTLENWLREFQQFCPTLKVHAYHADQKQRPQIQQDIVDDLDNIDVVVTTYTLAKSRDDNKFLRQLNPTCVIYDEGHVLRNSMAAGYQAYMRIKCQMRLLLTGTPLQNNLGELASLLGFVMPTLFEEHRDELKAIFSYKAKTTGGEQSHAALLSRRRIEKAKRMMAPFVLRRKKHQVLKHLPAKHCRVQYCKFSDSQAKIYEDERSRALKVMAARQAGEKVGNDTTHVMMTLRKASIHPMLFRRLYADKQLRKMSKACLKEPEFMASDPQYVFEDMEVMNDYELMRFCDRYRTMSPYRVKDEPWMDSGKVSALADLLKTYKANGDRVLVFSQFVMVLDILEPVLETLGISFFRLDGGTKIEERQDMLDQFYREPDITCFLLSTGAGGAGINLACANKVVIFDSSFNPQADIQAENRAHRVGQTREVEVVRLVTRGTIEEQILKLGQTKLELDERVGAGVEEGDAKTVEGRGAAMVAEMMIQKEEGKEEEKTDAKDEANDAPAAAEDEAARTEAKESTDSLTKEGE